MLDLQFLVDVYQQGHPNNGNKYDGKCQIWIVWIKTVRWHCCFSVPEVIELRLIGTAADGDEKHQVATLGFSYAQDIALIRTREETE